MSPFLTEIDSRAAIKGSRDPLGQMAIWTRFGRYVVGNLTTVSTSMRDFTVLLLGLWLVEQVVDGGSEESDLDVFIKWEQVAGYARALNNRKAAFRGVEQVLHNLSETPHKVTISADRGFQILGNQKIYGIWGLYTVAARSSGLVEGDPPRLAPAARAFVETIYVEALERAGFKNGGALIKLLSQQTGSLQPEGKDAKLLETLGKMLRPDKVSSAERKFYDEFIVRGGRLDDTGGRQAHLANLLEETLANSDFSLDGRSIVDLAKRAKMEETGLAEQLLRIRHCEALLAPASRLFQFLLTKDQSPITKIADDIRGSWSDKVSIDVKELAGLVPEITAAVGEVAANRWSAVATSLATGAYEDVVRLLIDQNAWVMKDRASAAPWIEINADRLNVRFKDESAELPKRKELAALWRFPYFIDSLRTMTAQVRTTGET